MNFLAIIVGGVIGAAVFQGGDGCIVGAVIGYLLDQLAVLRRRIEKLEGPSKKTTKQFQKTPLSESVFELPEFVPSPEPTDYSSPIPPQFQEPAPYTRKFSEAKAFNTEGSAEDNVKEDILGTSDNLTLDRVKDRTADSIWTSFASWFESYFKNKNPIVVGGVVVLFFGICFLLSYAIQNGYFTVSIETRFFGVALLGAGLFGFGWKVKDTRRDFAMAVQGGAIAILYAAAVTAYRQYGLLSQPNALVCLTLLTIILVGVSVKQNALILAVLGTVGGYLAPICCSSGSGNYKFLFAFYGILSIGIAAVQLKKNWRILSQIGFSITALIAGGWILSRYEPEMLMEVAPYVIGFILLYSILPFLELKNNQKLDPYLIFGAPFIGGLLQFYLVRHFTYGISWSCVGLSVLSFGLLIGAKKCFPEERYYQQICSGVAIVFAALAIPFAFSNQVTAIVWAIAGAGIYSSDQKNKNLGWNSIIGFLLQLGAAITFVLQLGAASRSELVIDPKSVTAFWLAIAALFSAWAGDKRSTGEKDGIFNLLFSWGVILFFGFSIYEANRQVSGEYQQLAVLLAATFVVLLFEFVGTYLGWMRVRSAARLLPILLPIIFFSFTFSLEHPFEYYGWIGWLYSIGVSYLVVLRQEKEVDLSYLHSFLFGNILLLSCSEADWIGRPYGPEYYLLPLVVFWTGLFALFMQISRRLYRVTFSTILFGLISLGSLGLLRLSGEFCQIQYLPILNPIDIAQILFGIAGVVWLRSLRRNCSLEHWQIGVQRSLLFLAFMALNGTIARSVHHWGNVHYSLSQLESSSVFQTSLSIVWGVIGLALILIATKISRRDLWVSGAILIGVVVVKLFIIDLSHVDTIARIISFLGIGFLMVVIGYISPLPPKEKLVSDL